MRCREVQAIWDDMREAGESVRACVLSHLHTCAQCQALYKAYEGVASCLSCLPPVEPPCGLTSKILQCIKSCKADGLAEMLSPLGLLHVAFRENRITYIAIDRGEDLTATRTRIERRLRRSLKAAKLPDHLREAITTYFQTHRVDLRHVDIDALTTFEQAALRQAAAIPPGEVRSYGWIAVAIGHPHAARAVGQAMARNPVPLLYPCHRVVDASGDLHNYGYGVEMKRRILLMEGFISARSNLTNLFDE
jgi:methylated-DNA-[protein]-cysteine S-methyltransferase